MLPLGFLLSQVFVQHKQDLLGSGQSPSEGSEGGGVSLMGP